MRLTCWLFGREVFALDLGAGADDEADPLRDLGATGHYPVTFTGTYEPMDEIPLPMRGNGWGDEGNRA